jgi:peptidoglycan/LPS O-acetylase OafA/YrhL
MKTELISTKPHYAILDGLRGVASLMVVAFHICEAHATSHLDQVINHGYLAVDFFFLLSGFVIGYAYDDRWGKMSNKEFLMRRMVRLQPMVVMGMIVGGICFYFQDSILWPNIHNVPIWKTILVMFIGFTMIPLPLSMDTRGWMEMYPLNGPAWSLFYEYIVNLLYGIGLRKLSNRALTILVILAAAALIHFAVTSTGGDVIGGWSLEPIQLRTGITRVMFPFFAGLLLSRTVQLARIRNAFLLCSLLVILVLSIPRIGGSEHIWMNGLYDSLNIILVFPLIVYLGASGEVKGRYATRVCHFFGDISYPLYITHYPIIYIYTAWVATNKVSLSDAWPTGIIVLLSCITLSYTCLKLYDEPVRKWLTRKLLVKRKEHGVLKPGQEF